MHTPGARIPSVSVPPLRERDTLSPSPRERGSVTLSSLLPPKPPPRPPWRPSTSPSSIACTFLEVHTPAAAEGFAKIFRATTLLPPKPACRFGSFKSERLGSPIFLHSSDIVRVDTEAQRTRDNLISRPPLRRPLFFLILPKHIEALHSEVILLKFITILCWSEVTTQSKQERRSVV